ncbi:nitrogen regulation protein NR [Vibrionales bacterium C3R12]|nr:nitrogen regulation protein NR [Vibrionales bacterium C3R12]
MKSIVAIISLILAWSILFIRPITSHAQEVYTWEDENNVIHFNDNALNAKSLTITLPDYQAEPPAPEIENIATNAMPSETPNEPKVKANDNIVKYVKPQPAKPERLTITLSAPQHEETIRSTRGTIPISAQINRKLGIGEQLQLMLNGKRYGAPQIQSNWVLKNIDRGAHTISIQAVRSGKLIASTTPITVYLHRATAK